MGGRRANVARHQAIYEAAEQNPGSTCGEIGQIIGLNHRTVSNALTSMQATGFLLAEEDGKLWAYRKASENDTAELRARKIIRLHRTGWVRHEIEIKVFGYKGGGARDRVAAVLEGVG